jgi:hypothetical protein
MAKGYVKGRRFDAGGGHIAGGEGSYSSIKACQTATSKAEGKGGEGSTRPKPTPMTYGLYAKGK